MRCLSFATMFLTAAAITWAEPSDPAPLFAQKGKLILEDRFAAAPVAPEWKVAKGKWDIVDGALKGVEKAEDSHAAVIRRDLPARNFIVQFSFRFDGGKLAAVSINNSKGHVCRLRLTPTLIGLNKDKPGKNSEEKPASLDTKTLSLKPGQWHTILLEVCGKQMVATLDGQAVIAGSHDGIDVDKTNIGLPVSGDSVSFKDLKVWEATAPTDTAAAMKAIEDRRGKTAAK